jgi:hypothetical protein
MYRDCPSFALFLSEKLRCRNLADFLTRVSKSWYKPKGQSQPQNALPKIMDATTSIPTTMAIFSNPEVV